MKPETYRPKPRARTLVSLALLVLAGMVAAAPVGAADESQPSQCDRGFVGPGGRCYELKEYCEGRVSLIGRICISV